MIKAGSVVKGMYLNWRDEPVVVVDKKFSHFGRGAANVRLKLKSIKTGKILSESFKTDDLVEETNVEYRTAQFLYKSDSQFVFMDPHTYEQYELNELIIGSNKGFLKEGASCQLVIYQEKVIGTKLPRKMAFKVIKTETVVKGNTVTGATKPAKLNTGLIIKVPLFIKKGEEIVVSTETREYVSRKN